MVRLIVVGLLAFAVALTGTAYAEVQNIKVSGDIDMKAIIHHNYDLKRKQKNEPGSAGGTTPAVTTDDNENFYLSTVHVGVDADLTDNVSAHVKLLNQRKWDSHSTTNDDDIHLDNAYVTLKEFLYSPLTVVAGRQNLLYGTGFIVGDGLLADPDSIYTASIGREYSAFNAFDAIRFILDYAPVTVEGLIAKVGETNVTDDDTDLYGFLVNYKLDRWNAEIEPYWFYKSDEVAGLVVSDALVSGVGATGRTYENNYVHTVGLRVAGSPIENLQLSGEGAHQWGTLIDNAPYQERKRDSWGAIVDARYTWAQVPWTPVTGIGWVFYSGEETIDANGADHSDEFNAWDAMYRGSFTTYIQDFLTGKDGGSLYTTSDVDDTSATTNRHLLYFDVGAKALEDLGLWARYTHVWFDEAPRIRRSATVGDELDLKATYDYTEDVQLAVFGGWFFPGKYYDQVESTSARANDLAWTAGGAAAVKF